jgi:cytochrome P450
VARRSTFSSGRPNRDSEAFVEPDRLDIQRAEARRNVAFGVGRHHCIGNQLARLEAQIAIGTLARRFPGMSLACDAAEVSRRVTPFNRGPESLPVRFGAELSHG